MTANDTDTLLARTIRDGYRRGWAFTPLDGKRPKLTGWQNRPREALGEALRWVRELQLDGEIEDRAEAVRRVREAYPPELDED